MEAGDDEQEGETRPDLAVPNYLLLLRTAASATTGEGPSLSFFVGKLGARYCIRVAYEEVHHCCWYYYNPFYQVQLIMVPKERGFLNYYNVRRERCYGRMYSFDYGQVIEMVIRDTKR